MVKIQGMRRALALLSLALAALAVVAAPAGASQPRHGLGFELHAGGFWITAKSPLGSERVRLMLDRHGEVAYYWAPARVGPDSVRVRFGRLGTLAFRSSLFIRNAGAPTVVSIIATARLRFFFRIAASSAASARSIGIAYFGIRGHGMLYLTGFAEETRGIGFVAYRWKISGRYSGCPNWQSIRT